MNGAAKRAACTAAVVLFVLFSVVIKGAKSIICYKCISKYDQRCGDPFIPYTLGMVDCNLTERPSHLEEASAICRKSIQRIHGSIRIVRDCGYTKDPAHDDQECYSRLGSKDIDVTHCSCSGDKCNGSTTSVPNEPSRVTIILVVASVLGFVLQGF